MTAQTFELRWIAPPSPKTHPSFALVRHGEELFSYAELLLHTPFEHITASLDKGSASPQEWWDDLVRRVPTIARQTIARCQPRDFEILDLYAMDPSGSA